MHYQLGINGPKTGLVGMIPFERLSDALQAAEAAVKKGYFRNARSLIWLEDGACLNVMSADEAARTSTEDTEQALVAAADGVVLHIQFLELGLPPFSFETAESADAAIDRMLETGVFRWTLKEDHDYLFAKLGPGTVITKMPVKEYRDILQAQQAQRRVSATPGPKLIVPGKH